MFENLTIQLKLLFSLLWGGGGGGVMVFNATSYYSYIVFTIMRIKIK